MVVCLTSARFNMKADILRQTPTSVETTPGNWTTTQDPDSGELIRQWQEGTTDQGTPNTTSDDLQSFTCLARPIISLATSRGAEVFSTVYSNTEYVRIWFPPNVVMSKRDRVTNIRDRAGNIIWREEERIDDAPTVFDVTSVTPVLDPFGRHVETTALLERVETQ